MEEPQCDGGTDAQTEVESRRVVIALLLEVVGVWWPTLSCSREEGRKAALSCRSRPDGDQTGFDVLIALSHGDKFFRAGGMRRGNAVVEAGQIVTGQLQTCLSHCHKLF